MAPGGRELAAFWGGGPKVGVDLDESRAYYQAVWRFLRRVQTPNDLRTGMVFVGPGGRRYSIALDEAHVRAVLAAEGQRWTAWVHTTRDLIMKLRAGGDTVTEADVRHLTMSYLIADMGLADAERLDLVVCVLAKHAIQATTGKTPYDPKGRSNDPLDLDLLYGIPLPAVVCTADEHFQRLVRSTDSVDRGAVMTPTELLEYLGRSSG